MNVRGWLQAGRGWGTEGVDWIKMKQTPPTHSAVRVQVAQRMQTVWLPSWSPLLHHFH